MKAFLVIEGAFYEGDHVRAAFFDKKLAIKYMDKEVENSYNKSSIGGSFKKDIYGNYDNGLDFYRIDEIEII